MADNDLDRQQMIDRIAANLERFDEETLGEFDRLTNPDTDLVSEPSPGSQRKLTRREAIAGGIGGLAGVAIAAVAGGGSVIAARTGDGPDPEIERLNAKLAAHVQLEDVGIDGVAKAGLQSVGAAVIEAGTAAAALRAGLDVVEATLSVPVQGVDTAFFSMLRQNVLEPAHETVLALDDLTETWRLEMATPIQARLDERDELRRRMASPQAADDVAKDP